MFATIAQLSDIHFQEGNNPAMSRAALIADAIVSAEQSSSDFILALSGDIAKTGSPNEYKIAENFILSVAARIQEHKSDATIWYISVPGNHDCYLSSEFTQIRSIMIDGIGQTLQATPLDQGILKTVLLPQDNYFEFAKGLHWPTSSVMEKVCSSHAFAVGSYSIQFLLYNTAILSQRKELQGTLEIPMTVVRDRAVVDPTCNLTVSMFHHPYNWLRAEVGIEFGNHIQRTCEIALTGHQHVEGGFEVRRVSGDRTFYSEGDVLQESDGRDESGFKVIVVNLLKSTFRSFAYKWKLKMFTAVETSGEMEYSRVKLALDRPSPTASFLSSLNDSGVGLTHKSKGAVPLDAVFVFPDAATSNLGRGATSKHIRGEHLSRYFDAASKVIVQGSIYTGKTALAKTLVKGWLTNQLVFPLLIDGSDIHNIDGSEIDKVVNKAISAQYGDAHRERYNQLLPSSRAIVVDDFDQCRLSSADRDKFMRQVAARFGKVVLFVRSMSSYQYLLASLDGKEEAILEYELISLKSLSHFTRGALIEKWLKLGASQDQQHFSRRVTETERLVENVIGKNTLPSLPFITLAILEASDRNTEILPENGSFGYLYEVLITSALSSSGGKHPQLDKKYKFLSILAFQMFERETDVISHSDVDALLDDYAVRFKITIDKAGIVSDLTNARVLVDENGNYTFAYDHFFFYFLARHFKEGLMSEHSEQVRSSLMSIASGLHTGGNSIFLMFVMYLTHDRELTEKLVSTADSILTEYELSTLGDEVDFYSAKDSHARTRRIPETENYQENRNENRRQLDAIAERQVQRQRPTKTEVVRECGGYSDDLPSQTKLDYAFSCIQLLGQVLRNFTGSMPGDTKVAILTSSYRLGLRVLRHLLQNLEDASAEASRVIEQQDQSKPEGREMVRQIEKLLTMIGEIVGSGIIHTISQSVGSPDIGLSAYEEAVSQVGKSNAVSLIDLSIKLDHAGEYPFNLIKQLVDEFDSSRLAHVILCNLVLDNMQVFEIDWRMRQRVLSILKVKVAGEALVSRSNKRLKGDNN